MWNSLALALFGISALVQVSVQGPHQRALLKSLLKDYNPMERPVANDSQPLTVVLSLSLVQIMDVDEKNQVLTTNIWLNMRWYDHYLQWNQSEYPGVKNLRFTTDQIWTPDILLYNSADEEFDSTFKTNVLVNSSGYCNYLPPGVPGTRNELFYDCCKEPYPDVTFVVTIRRRTLYYALNLLIPCMLLSSMTLLIFLLPADSGEKISLGITVLLSLTVFMLLVAEIMPATSDSIPLIGQYFASIMIIVGMSVIATVVVLQYHHHDPNGGNMPKWVQLVLLQWVAWFLRMKRPGEGEVAERPCAPHLRRCSSGSQSGSLPNAAGSMDIHHAHHHQNAAHHPLLPTTLHPLHPQNLLHAAAVSTAAAGSSHPNHLHSQGGVASNNGNLLYIGFPSLDEASPPGLLGEPLPRNSLSGGSRAVQLPASVAASSPPAAASSPPPHLPSQFCSPPPPPTPNLEAMGCPSTVSGGGACSCSAGSGSGGDAQLQAVLDELRYLADRFRAQDENESAAEQWKFAAAVIDRLCLVAFSVFNIICTISILMSAPNFVEAVSKDFI
ncbi:cholinergic receptor, nicotinic, alpha 11 isoform X2 [Brachyhypopomus gauderio]|uniref:cholinergic receptor, nicotinic, alpha 11 isoform X2 n=1 Tax=Brachyhypopomus gauderio TaxID=698409 RepID=UPI0040419E06